MLRLFPLLLILAGLPGPAGAYLLPAKHVLRKAAARVAATPGLQVTLTGRVRAPGEAAAFGVGERWVFTREQDPRVDVNGPAGRKASWSRSGGVSGDPALLPTELERLVFTHVFGDNDLRALADALGIDVRNQSLALAGDRPVWVLGATARDRATPQMWVDHEDFTLLRVQALDGERRLVELDLLDWALPPGQGRFPSRVRVTREGRPLRTLDTEGVRVGTAP